MIRSRYSRCGSSMCGFPCRPDVGRLASRWVAVILLAMRLSEQGGLSSWSSEEADIDRASPRRMVGCRQKIRSRMHMTPTRLGRLRRYSSSDSAGLVDALVAVISPSFNPIDGSDTRECLDRVARELPEHELPALRLECAYVHLVPERRGELLRAHRRGDRVVDRSNRCRWTTSRLGHCGED